MTEMLDTQKKMVMQGLLTDSNKFCTVKVSLPRSKSLPTPTTFSPLSRVGGRRPDAGVEVESRYVSKYLSSHISAPQGGVGTHGWPEGSTRQEPAAKGGFGGSCCYWRADALCRLLPPKADVSHLSTQFNLNLADGLLMLQNTSYHHILNKYYHKMHLSIGCKYTKTYKCIQ